jgi:hypothetical protein
MPTRPRSEKAVAENAVVSPGRPKPNRSLASPKPGSAWRLSGSVKVAKVVRDKARAVHIREASPEKVGSGNTYLMQIFDV